MPPKNPTKRYQKKDPISHCLDRPDMYVGSTRLRNVYEYIADSKDNGEYYIYNKEINSSPAILRIFIEALSNAIDNVERSKQTDTPCTTIKVSIDKDTGLTSIWNDGDVIPIEMDPDENVYNHTMIFGQLLTGSNYDDEEERIVAGRNGLGIKLCSIFSTSFTVEGVDPKQQKIFTQSWTNNMRDVGEPIVKNKKGKGYTKVSWTPDFAHFGMDNYSDDIIQLYTRHVIDAAMISKVKVYLNDKLIPIKNLQQYSQLYDTPTTEKLYIKTESAEVLVTPSSSFQVISFVNGVYTRLGGQHVDAWSEEIFRPIVDKFNGKDKKAKTKTPKINITDVKQFFRLFIVSTVVRPEFDGQDKNKLEAPQVVAQVKLSHINSITKWSVMDNIEDIIRSKEMLVLKKAEKGKKKNVKVEGLDPANNAGGKYSSDCSLFVCEGLSAKTYVVAGIDTGVYGKKGRDWFGVLPVTGKLLNVRNATPTSIADNKVIVSFIQTTGLRHGIDYTVEENFKTLSYGKVIVVADADCDGIHIEGLIMNLIHSLFPSLLDRKEPYLIGMKTPIARVFIPKKDDLLFYDEVRFNKYISEQTKKVNAKYYKGLGTTREEDVPDTFGLKMIEYITDNNSNTNMNKVFHKKYADARKTWLEEYSPHEQSFSLDDQDNISQMSISNFLNGEMIKFSHADCARSIPNGIDGLKESQRKILYAVRKRNLKYSGNSLKVAQLSGYTAEHSNYHHGEQNLQDTIIHMASGFPGTNNIPLLYPDGGFGTRLEGGKDAASARYIFTKMEGMTEYIFRSEDDPLLTPVNDDGDLVQPEHYIPIIPMILVNGCTAGIGTGWSCNIPCYNPIDIVSSLREWIKNDGEVMLEDPDDGTITSTLPPLTPWYRDFKGEITQDSNNRFITKGIVTELKKGVKEVSELPIGMWTNKFKEQCEDLIADKKIKTMKNYSTTRDVNFVLTEQNDEMYCNINNLKLHTYVYTSNMVLFDEKEKLRKYDNVDQIIINFCKVRLEYYVKRKKHQVDTLEKEIKHMGNKERFVLDVIDNTLDIMNVPEDVVIAELKKREYDEEPEQGGYDYLLRLQVRTFTADKVKQLKNDITSSKKKLDALNKTTPEKMWLNDLDEFEKQYDKWMKDMAGRVPKKTKGKK
jgi:DNA topoisomerase-2